MGSHREGIYVKQGLKLFRKALIELIGGAAGI